MENHDCNAGNIWRNLHAITEGNIEEEKYEDNNKDSEEESTDDDDEDEDDTTISEDDEYDAFTVLQEIVCSNHDKAAIPKSWILLDSQSTVNVFSNKKYITNIRESKHVLTLYCNTG